MFGANILFFSIFAHDSADIDSATININICCKGSAMAPYLVAKR